MVRAAFKAGGVARVLSARVFEMAARGENQRENPDDEANLSARLERLGERLAQANRPAEADHSATRQSTDTSGLARGLRLSTELVAGVIVGGVVGWLLDRWLGSTPWGFIVLLLLGFAAGILNVMRSVGAIAERTPTK